MKTKLRILIIEDSEDDTFLVLHQIKKGGYDIEFERVETAKDMETILKEKTWDIIFSDYRMPYFNGLKALAIFKESGIDIPFIIISGTIGEDIAVETMKAGAHDYIMKNNMQRLLPAVERELREAKNRAERKLLEQKQKQAEAIRESEEKFRNLVWDMQVGVLLQNPQAEILLSNPKALELLGINEDQLLGKTSFAPDWSVIHEDGTSFPEYSHPVPQAIANRRSVRNIVMGVHRPTKGDLVWLLMDAIPLLHDDGTVRQVVCTFIDITKRKQAEEVIKHKNEELLKLNAEKDKFFSIIAHDLKSPFSGFLGLTKIMAEEIQELTMKEMQDYSKDLFKSADSLYKLLENLLEWSRVQRGVIEFNPVLCFIVLLVKQNIAIQSEAAKRKQIEFLTVIPDSASVYADIPMFNAVLRNLISNAIKFTPRGGSVEIGTKPSDALKTSEVCIYIKDSGIGMKSEILNKLFMLNEKVTRNGTENESSTGLGLLLCKEFIEKHGGRIWAESKEGKGSTFYFTLPTRD